MSNRLSELNPGEYFIIETPSQEGNVYRFINNHGTNYLYAYLDVDNNTVYGTNEDTVVEKL